MERAIEFQRLWDGTEPGWVVVRQITDRAELVISFGSEGPTVREVRSLRTLVPDLAERSAADVLASLREARELSLGLLESRVALALQKECERAGLRVERKPKQLISYSLVNEQTRRFLLIEDDDTLRAVSAEAIQRGLPVREALS